MGPYMAKRSTNKEVACKHPIVTSCFAVLHSVSDILWLTSFGCLQGWTFVYPLLHHDYFLFPLRAVDECSNLDTTEGYDGILYMYSPAPAALPGRFGPEAFG